MQWHFLFILFNFINFTIDLYFISPCHGDVTRMNYILKKEKKTLTCNDMNNHIFSFIVFSSFSFWISYLRIILCNFRFVTNQRYIRKKFIISLLKTLSKQVSLKYSILTGGWYIKHFLHGYRYQYGMTYTETVYFIGT